MKKLLLLLPLLLFSCNPGVTELKIDQSELPEGLKGLKIYQVKDEIGNECYIPILNNSFHDKKNISVVNKSSNEIIVVDEMVSKNDSIVVFKIKNRNDRVD